jgi:nuclear GTP-binding protein
VYGVQDWEDSDDFINQLAVKTGKLLKGGEPDVNNVSKSMIMDWQRGNIPYFELPPKTEEEQDKEDNKDEGDEEDKN